MATIIIMRDEPKDMVPHSCPIWKPRFIKNTIT
jgi:hypothetical protein